MKNLQKFQFVLLLFGIHLTQAQIKPRLYTLQKSPIIEEEPGITSFFSKVVFDQNRYYMIYSKGTNHKNYATYLATSADGLKWNKRKDPILTIDNAINKNGQCVLWAIPVKMEKEWQLFYIVKDTMDNPLSIERAIAPTIGKDWEIDTVFGLEDKSKGTDWDSGQLHPNDIVYHDGTYYLYYEAFKGSNRSSSIGLATSLDGINWDKYNNPETKGRFTFSDPVLTPGLENSWDEYTTVTADVRVSEGIWEMVYTGVARDRMTKIGYASSPDGIHWKKSEEPILKLQDDRKLYFPELIKLNGQDLLKVFVNDLERKISNIQIAK